MPKGRSYTPMSEDQMAKSTTLYVDKETEAILLKEMQEFGESMREIIAKALKEYHLSFKHRSEERQKNELKELRKKNEAEIKKTKAAIKKLEIEKALLLMEMSKLQELVV